MTRRRGLRALLVILADDYGDPTHGPSFEFETFVPPLRRFFDEVTVFPQDRELRHRGYFGASQALTDLVRLERPDFLFCVPFENQVDWQALGRIATEGTPTVAWMCDDHWRWNNFSRHIAPCFTAVVTTDRQAYVAYHRLQGVMPILSQWAVDSARLRSVDSTRDIPVSFVGACRPHRDHMIRALRRAGISVFVRGTGWPEGRATTEELAEIPGRSLVSLNFSDSSQTHAGGSTQLKARLFELGGSGSCVVTEPDPQLAAFYDSSTEVVVAAGERDFARSVRSLLADDGVRAGRAKATLVRTAEHHTYDIRFEAIFSILGMELHPRASEGALCITR